MLTDSLVILNYLFDFISLAMLKIVLKWPIENKKQLKGNLEVISVMICKELLTVISHREQGWGNEGKWTFSL